MCCDANAPVLRGDVFAHEPSLNLTPVVAEVRLGVIGVVRHEMRADDGHDERDGAEKEMDEEGADRPARDADETRGGRDDGDGAHGGEEMRGPRAADAVFRARANVFDDDGALVVGKLFHSRFHHRGKRRVQVNVGRGVDAGERDGEVNHRGIDLAVNPSPRVLLVVDPHGASRERRVPRRRRGRRRRRG